MKSMQSRITRGLAKYILNNGVKKSVAIAYDSRNMSEEFARTAAKILSKIGIEVYLFDMMLIQKKEIVVKKSGCKDMC